MVTMERIIVGVDGSVPSRAAIRWSVERARSHDTGVILVHVMDDEWGAVGSQLIAEANRGSVETLDAALRMAEELAPDLHVSVQLLSGSPMWELAQLSNETTLVVVGTHKTGFHYGRAFGSRSLQLASLAAGPIAVIPESAVRLRRGVVVGIDDTTAGRGALTAAANEADRAGSELTLVRALDVAPPGYLDDDGRRSWQEQVDALARRQLAAAVSRVQEFHPHLATRSRIIRRPAGVALNEVSRTAELLVVGSSRRSGFEPTNGLGSVAYDVLLNLVCPTMVVHAYVGESTRPEAPHSKEEHHEHAR
jgi:nucleotide-binding universal stress UspA family protein